MRIPQIRTKRHISIIQSIAIEAHAKSAVNAFVLKSSLITESEGEIFDEIIFEAEIQVGSTSRIFIQSAATKNSPLKI